MKSLGSLKCLNPIFSLLLIRNWCYVSNGSFAYKYILSIFGWLFIKVNNAFVFPDPEPPTISILYGWSRIYGHFLLCFALFSFAYSSKLIIYIYLSPYFTFTYFKDICFIWICCNSIKNLLSFTIITS